jgi:uncharacterized protein YjeT (DUF2065 family)
MNNKLSRILWVDDDRLRRHGRLLGYLNIGLGCLFLLSCVFINTFSEVVTDRIDGIYRSIVSDLSKIQLHEESDVKTIQLASGLILKFSKFFKKLLFPTSIVLLALGILFIFQGILYFRVCEILNRNGNMKIE